MDKPHNHNCDCGHEHSHEELLGKVSEIPAVFSYKKSIKFNKPVIGNELCTKLVEWIEAIKLWTSQNKYFIGHIKVFIENEGNFNLWISTTGNKVNTKRSEGWNNVMLNNCDINITAIVFGVQKDILERVILEKFKID